MRALVAGLLAVVALAGCGGGGSERPPNGLASDEERWVRELVGWMQSVDEATARVADLRSRVLAGDRDLRPQFDDAVESVVACRARFAEGPGDAPSARLEEIERLAVRACDEFARSARAGARAFGGDPGDSVAIADAALAEANRLWLETDRELELLATWNRPLPVAGGDRTTSRIEPRFSRIGTRLANRRVRVRCWSRDDWSDVFREWQAFANDRDLAIGFVASFDRGELSLHPDVCAGLVRLTYRRDVPTGGELLDVADAVAVLAHEIEHLVAPAYEAVTECRAMQAIRDVARALGASPGDAARLAEVYWTELYPTNDEEYLTPDCRDGGPYDLDPASAVWP